MKNKGRVYTGMSAGKNYDLRALFLGMGKSFYEKAVAGINLSSKMRILDLGCGTGKLIFTLAKRSPVDVEFYGCDYSPEQTAYANELKRQFSHEISITTGSMDELSYPDNHFDLILCCMALHAVTNEFHKSTIENAARMLHPDGRFVLVDMIKPKFEFLRSFLPVSVRNSQKSFDLQAITVLFEQAGFVREFSEKLNFWITRQVFMFRPVR